MSISQLNCVLVEDHQRLITHGKTFRKKIQNTWLPGAKKRSEKYKIPGFTWAKKTFGKKRKDLILIHYIYLFMLFILSIYDSFTVKSVVDSSLI